MILNSKINQTKVKKILKAKLKINRILNNLQIKIKEKWFSILNQKIIITRPNLII